MAYCYQWLEYWTLIVQWFSTDEWNMAPALLTWPCSLFCWDPDTGSFSMIVVDVDWYLIPANWPQSCRWIFIGLWLYWRTDVGSEWPVSSNMVTGSNLLLKLWIAVLCKVALVLNSCNLYHIFHNGTNTFLLQRRFFLYYTSVFGESITWR